MLIWIFKGGVWTPHSLETLKRIAALTANRALQNLRQQLSVGCGNARLVRSRLQVLDDVAGWDLPG